MLIFLVPARRQALIAHELEARMRCRSEHHEELGLTTLNNGQLVAVVSWGRMLAEVQGCLDEAETPTDSRISHN